MPLKHWSTHRFRHAVAGMGLADRLHVTTPEPATEMTSVAAVAPATVVTTAPTCLQHCLRRLT